MSQISTNVASQRTNPHTTPEVPPMAAIQTWPDQTTVDDRTELRTPPPPPLVPVTGPGRLARLGPWALRAASLTAAIALWHLLTTNEVDVWLRFSRVPPPAEVVEAFRLQLSDGLHMHVLSSMQRILTGFLMAAAVGVSVGMMLARSARFSHVVRPLVEVVRPIPAIAWVPLAILVFPTSEQGIVFITFLAAFFPMVVSTLHAVRALPEVWEQAARTMGAGSWAVWSRILLPGILPGVFSGLSVAMGVAWICVISAEMISGQLGIGYFTWQSYGLLDYPGVIVGMLTIGLLGWLSAAVIELFGRRLTRWLPTGEGSR